MRESETSTHGARPDRRAALTLAAFETIAVKGFEGLRVRDIAAQVGINGATLHHYFPTKEHLIQAVVEYTLSHLRTVMIQPAASASPTAQLRDHLARLYALMQSEPELFVVLTEVSLRARRTPVLDYLMEQKGAWHAMLNGVIERGVAQGIWPADTDADATAWAIIAFMEGTSSWAASSPEHAEKVIAQLARWLGIA